MLTDSQSLAEGKGGSLLTRTRVSTPAPHDEENTSTAQILGSASSVRPLFNQREEELLVLNGSYFQKVSWEKPRSSSRELKIEDNEIWECNLLFCHIQWNTKQLKERMGVSRYVLIWKELNDRLSKKKKKEAGKQLYRLVRLCKMGVDEAGTPVFAGIGIRVLGYMRNY